MIGRGKMMEEGCWKRDDWEEMLGMLAVPSL